MESLEIVCESCERRMRLSKSLLGKVAGKSGRVTCRKCQNKIVLDATNGEVRVTKGGYEAGALEPNEIEDFTEVPPSVDPHLSELPLEPVGSVSSPLSEQAAGSDEAPESFKVLTPGPDDVAAAMRFSQESAVEFEAPAPDFNSDGSLSPHAIDEDEEDLVSLGREFNSSPFSSERDASYNSLFPGAAPKVAHRTPSFPREAPAPVISLPPSPPKRGELRRMKSDPEIFAEDVCTAPAVAATVVEMGPDGQLINLSDKKRPLAGQDRSGHWIPWTVAAIALLGLGVSVTVNRGSAIAYDSAQGESQSVLPAAASEAQVAVEEPAQAVVEAAEEAFEAEEAVEAEEAAQPKEEPAREKALVVDAASGKLEASSKNRAVAQESSEESRAQASDRTSASRKEEADATAKASAQEAEETDVDTEEPIVSPFSTSAASTALREATALASACRKTGDPTGSAKVVVTFAPSGRVTRAAVTGAPFAGTETGGCIASRFRTARVPSFSGEHVTVSKTVSIR